MATVEPTQFHCDLLNVVERDVKALIRAEQSYGHSWKKRGGVGAFMMLARKWDRLENHLSKTDRGFQQYDILGAAEADKRPEGIIDDIRDLRRYLALVEAELVSRGSCAGALPKDSEDCPFCGQQNGCHAPECPFVPGDVPDHDREDVNQA